MRKPKSQPKSIAASPAAVGRGRHAVYLQTLTDAAIQTRALLAVPSTTVKIPANIRAQMKGVVSLAAWWAKNPTVAVALEPQTKKAAA